MERILPDNLVPDDLPDQGPITVEEFEGVAMVDCERRVSGGETEQYCQIGERSRHGGNVFPLTEKVGPVVLKLHLEDDWHVTGGGPGTKVNAGRRVERGDDRLLDCDLEYYFDPSGRAEDFDHFKLRCS